MARARTIKPGFFKNDVLAECPPLARLLFAGLWTIADRAGRLEYRPKRIKAEVLPYDNCDIFDLVEQLRRRGFITVYGDKNNQYIQIITFDEHQNPHVNEAASIIPAPDEHHTSTVQEPEGSGLLPITYNLLPITDKSEDAPGAGPDASAEQLLNLYHKIEAEEKKPPASVVPVPEKEKNARGVSLQKFMEREFPAEPNLCPQEWGDAAVALAKKFHPGTKIDLVKMILWQWDKFVNWGVSNANRAVGRKSDWRRTWLNWWSSEFEKLAKQEERDGIYRDRLSNFKRG